MHCIGSFPFQFKEAISAKFNNAPIENLCLIFAGKILKDTENLSAHNIKDGMTIHLVIKQGGAASGSGSAPSPAPATSAGGPPPATSPGPAPAPPPADVSQSPFGLGGFGGIPGEIFNCILKCSARWPSRLVGYVFLIRL